jgi:hypothetical protein
MPTTTPILASVAAELPIRPTPVVRRWRTILATALATLCMLGLTAPAPAQAMITQSGAVCTSWADRPADGITVSFPRVSLAPGEAVWLIVHATTPDGRRYESNWNYAHGDSDWMTPGPAILGGQWISIAPRDGSGSPLSLPGAGLRFQAVIWLLPHTAGTDANVTGRWESHYAVNSATGDTWCSS